ncbi:MAG: tail fiber domain-containing protein, partial [Acutalibacteraceae bacterium]
GDDTDQVIYIPYSAQTFSYFFLEPLDSISLYDKISGKTYNTIITHTSFNLNQNMLVEAKGESDTKKGYATLNPLTAQEQSFLRQIKENISQVKSISNRELKLIEFNKTLNSAGALYHNIVAGVDDAPYDVYSDASDLANSTKFIVANAAGVGWSNLPWEEPGDKTPDVFCEYYISFDGETVLSDLSAYKIQANLIQTGSVVSNNGNTYFNLDDNVLVIANYKKGNNPAQGSYEIEMQSGQIDFKGATSNGSLGRTAKMRTGYTKDGNRYTGKHFAIGYISNTSGSGNDGANSLKFGAFDSITDKFTTLLQLSAAEGAVFSADVSGKINVKNKLGHFESNTEHNENSDYVGANSFSVGLKHYSASNNNSAYAWRQHYFGSYVDTSFRHWTGWQANDSNGNFMHSLTSMQADYASDTTVLRVSAYDVSSYISVGTNAAYFQKSYGAFNKDREMLSIYCDNVYLSNGTDSGTSVKDRLTDLYANKVSTSVTGTDQINGETHYETLLRHNNNLSDLYTNKVSTSVTGTDKINGETHSKQLDNLKYVTTYMKTNGTFCLRFREYGKAGNGEIGCSTSHNFGFYTSSAHDTYASIYAANVNNTSSQEYKKNISAADVNALELVKKSRIYSFNYKDSNDSVTLDSVGELTEDSVTNEQKSYGFIVERETPEEVISDDGKAVNLYAMSSINWKATQEL